jgi:hypothetical protein
LNPRKEHDAQSEEPEPKQPKTSDDVPDPIFTPVDALQMKATSITWRRTFPESEPGTDGVALSRVASSAGCGT